MEKTTWPNRTSYQAQGTSGINGQLTSRLNEHILGTDGSYKGRKGGKLPFEIVKFRSKSPAKKNSHKTKNKSPNRTRFTNLTY